MCVDFSNSWSCSDSVVNEFPSYLFAPSNRECGTCTHCCSFFFSPYKRALHVFVTPLKIAYRYHRIEFTVFFGNVKANFECFSLNALSLLLLLAVYLSSHLSISVTFLSSAELNSFMGIIDAFARVCVSECISVEKPMRCSAPYLSMYSFHSFAALFVCWTRKKVIWNSMERRRIKIVMRNHRKAQADCLLKNKKNTDTRHTTRRSAPSTATMPAEREKETIFFFFSSVCTFFTAPNTHTHTNEMLMVYGVPFFLSMFDS